MANDIYAGRFEDSAGLLGAKEWSLHIANLLDEGEGEASEGCWDGVDVAKQLSAAEKAQLLLRCLFTISSGAYLHGVREVGTYWRRHQGEWRCGRVSLPR